MAGVANMKIIGIPLYKESCEEASLSPKQRYIESLKNRLRNKRAIFGAKVSPHNISVVFAD